MSAAETPVETPEAAVEVKGRTLTMAERIKLVDWLRAQAEPVIGDTKVSISKKVSESVGFEVTAAQLWYMVDQLPDMKLGDKLHVRTTGQPTEMPQSIVAMFAEYKKQLDDYKKDLDAHREELQELRKSLDRLEDIAALKVVDVK